MVSSQKTDTEADLQTEGRAGAGYDPFEFEILFEIYFHKKKAEFTVLAFGLSANITLTTKPTTAAILECFLQ